MRLNHIYEVLTPDGWRDFKGVMNKGRKQTIRFVTEHGALVESTPEHIFYDEDGDPIKAGELTVGVSLMTTAGNMVITEITSGETQDVFDLVEVDHPEHQFLIDGGIVTKNCDEMAFLRPSIARDFWTAIQPVLSTGGGCIITSTPKSDEDQFAEIWKEANDNVDEFGNPAPGGVGSNGFFPIKVTWDKHPERDESWAAPFRKQLGEAKFKQEMECEFINDDQTLIEPVFLSKMKHIDPEFYTGVVRWYKEPEPNKTYLVGLDPCLGTGGDHAAIEVYEVPGMIQVAEWQHNKTPPRGQVKTLMQILTILHQEMENHPDQQGDPTIYWTVENNTLGEAILQIIEDTGEQEFPGMFISEKKKPGQSKRHRKGLNTNHTKKVNACAKLKSLIETERMTINSRNLVRELKNFIGNGVSWAAKSGEHDDLIMSTILVVRLLETVMNWLPTDTADELKDGIDNSDDDDYDAPMPIRF